MSVIWATILVLIMFASLQHVLPAVYAQDADGEQTTEEAKDEKDGWDRFEIIGTLFIGGGSVFIALALFIHTHRTQKAEALRREGELATRQLDTIQKFYEHIMSPDDDKRWPALSLIAAVGDEDLAAKVAKWYAAQTPVQADSEALGRLVENQDPGIADLAKRAYSASSTAQPPPSTEDLSQRFPILGRLPGPLGAISRELLEPEYWTQTDGVKASGNVNYKDPEEFHGKYVRTRGTHALELPREYKIGTFLITTRAFLRFIRGDGYGIDAFWDEESRGLRGKFLCRDGITNGPSTWPSDKGLPGMGDHPVAGVSYHEARAFCRWLDEKHPVAGWRWCLPSEDMWEFTARTAEGFNFPWGPEFGDGRCNSLESGIRNTSEVNRFPSGRSKYGCFDMAGNVWEFVDATDSMPSFCVLRGGSFINNESVVRSYFRLHSVRRQHRPWDFGFRCAMVRS